MQYLAPAEDLSSPHHRALQTSEHFGPLAALPVHTPAGQTGKKPHASTRVTAVDQTASQLPRHSESDIHFESVLREHAPTLSGVARRFCRSDSEREDLLQEVKVAIWRALPRFRGDSSLKTYIYRVAHNRASTITRRRQKPFIPMDDASPYGLDFGESQISQEDQLRGQRERQRLALAICDLPPTLRGVLRLELKDLSDAEIAHTCGITEKNVSVRLTRARQQLRKRLAPRDSQQG